MAKKTTGRDVRGVSPYPTGRNTASEQIEAGQQFEECQVGLTKPKAIDAARKLRARMKGGGWKLRVWQNMGWHYRVSRGAMNVSPSVYRGKTTYFTLMADVAGGDYGFPNWTETGFSRTDPNRAVADQLKLARAYVLQLRGAVASAEGRARCRTT